MEAHILKMGPESGRGFSLSEVQKAGFTVNQMRKLGIYVDLRRETLHESNVSELKSLVKKLQKQMEARKAEEKKKEIKKEKEEKKPKKEEKREKKKEEKKKKKEEKIEKEKKTIDIIEIKGVGKKKAETLKSVGISTVEDLLKANSDALAEKTGFTAEYIEKLKEQAGTL